jgi:hypothetical protein
MPNQPREGRTNRSVRVDDDDWNEFGTAAAATGTDRGWLIRQFIKWYLGKGDLPQRPGRRKAGAGDAG